jgi:hypothetical protein
MAEGPGFDALNSESVRLEDCCIKLVGVAHRLLFREDCAYVVDFCLQWSIIA